MTGEGLCQAGSELPLAHARSVAGEQRGHPGWVVVPTGECGGQSEGCMSGLEMAAVSVSKSADWVWSAPDWARLQHTLVLGRTRVGVGQSGLDLCPC